MQLRNIHFRIKLRSDIENVLILEDRGNWGRFISTTWYISDV